jgi:hypothetical protein
VQNEENFLAWWECVIRTEESDFADSRLKVDVHPDSHIFGPYHWTVISMAQRNVCLCQYWTVRTHKKLPFLEILFYSITNICDRLFTANSQLITIHFLIAVEPIYIYPSVISSSNECADYVKLKARCVAYIDVNKCERENEGRKKATYNNKPSRMYVYL